MHRKHVIVLRARQHRSALTSTEQLLWSHLNAGQLGVWFRRQAVIGGFIVDFLAPSARLVVEVDGPYHVTRQNADKRRDRTLAALGYRVVRIPSNLVTSDAHAALTRIRTALTP